MKFSGILSAAIALTASGALASPSPKPPVTQAACNGKKYSYNELAGYGFVASDAVDKYGDTISLGSSLAIKLKAKTASGSYKGTLYGLPDRGWNTNGSINFIPRLQKYSFEFTPAPGATAANPSPPNLKLTYLDTILFKDPRGEPCTGLDADIGGSADGLSFFGQTLPTATYPGDGFGGAGPGGKRVTIDAEGLVLADDGGFWISDEYGPYVYRFDAGGKMIGAVRPPNALLPLRNGSVGFSADTPPRSAPNQHPNPANPTQGRQNNQGFEGLTASPDGKTLYVLLQSAARQEGGKGNPTRWHTRFLQYDIGCEPPTLEAEYVVPLPRFNDSTGQKTAAQSEIHYVSPTQFLILARDSGNGRGMANSTSLYRHVDVFDISNATNIKGKFDAFNASVASDSAVLNKTITEATLCPFLDYNINSQLNRFSLHNGGAQDAGLLNEKWESLGLIPVDGVGSHGSDKNDEYYLFTISDNDFITQNGFINGGKIKYQDASGFNLSSQILVFKVSLPKGSTPLIS